MPRNVEIKARVLDLKQLLKLEAGLSGGPAKILHQEDVFFNACNGRLKLRDEVCIPYTHEHLTNKLL